MSVAKIFNLNRFKTLFKGEYMKYSVKQLAQAYTNDINEITIDLSIPITQSFDISTYNEYTYKKLMLQFDRLYRCTDSVYLSEQFLKGD